MIKENLSRIKESQVNEIYLLRKLWPIYLRIWAISWRHNSDGIIRF